MTQRLLHKCTAQYDNSMKWQCSKPQAFFLNKNEFRQKRSDFAEAQKKTCW